MILIYLIAVNAVLFVLMGVDKFKAQNNLWRIPEKVLLTLGIIGGGVGGFVGGRVFHHKTRKWYFQVVWVLGIILAAVLLTFFRGE